MKTNNIICFKANTLISSPKGLIKIQSVKPNDKIYSLNQNINNIEIITVQKTASSFHNNVAKITFDDYSFIEMTLDHPIWIISKGWSAFRKNNRYEIDIDKISIGDSCFALNKNLEISQKKITNIVFYKGYYEMYIISGGNHNNFFANGLLAHDENMLKLDLVSDGIIYNEK